jgi:hypothetical protein
MQHITKLKLAVIHMACDREDKSTEYMYQIMQDAVGVDIDTVNNYMTKEDHAKLFRELVELSKIYDYVIDCVI